jgi:PAS domain S-box-containing protein
MTYVIGALLMIVVAVQATAIAALVIRTVRQTRAERALRVSEERLRYVLENVPSMIWTARPDTTLDYLNQTCAEFTGLSIERLRNEGWLDAVHPEDRDRLIATYTPAFEKRTRVLAEYRVRSADGTYRWLLASGVPKYGPDGSYSGYVGCDFDITERKNAEEVMRASRSALEASNREIRLLAGRLIQAQDAERARIARDLHDDVSQQLAGLSIALSGLTHRLDAFRVAEDLRADLRTLHERLTILAHSVRGLSHDLHPTVLHHAGLVTALKAYCSEVQRAHGTEMNCSAEGDFESIPAQVALSLYRIAQEAVRNVIAHAEAGRADVHLYRVGDQAELTVTDDGNGFDVGSSLTRGKGLGLVSIAERVRLASGSVRITAESTKGTCVRVQIPVIAMARGDAGNGAEEARREYGLT